MSDAEALGWALQAAQAAAGEGASLDRLSRERLTRAGTAAIDALLSCEAHGGWARPSAGAPDPLRAARHDVRAAAQTVLGQLELIGIAWQSWDAAGRTRMLGELEDSTRELGEQARLFAAAGS